MRIFFALTVAAFFEPLVCAQSDNPYSESIYSMTRTARAVLDSAIDRKFGSDQLVYASTLPVDFGTKEADGLQREFGWKLRLGRKLYEQKCASCHGRWGDGDGVAADKLNTPPRGFHSKLFRWKSTLSHYPPRTHDIAETIRIGIPGTPMRSNKLTEEARYAVAEYVRWLSIRLQVRRWLCVEIKDMEGVNADELMELLSEALEIVSHKWKSAEESELEFPDDRPATHESIARGKLLYTKLSCHKCHGKTGAGDGEETRIRDLSPVTRKQFEKPGFRNAEGLLVTLGDLRTDLMKGGGGRADLYLRIVNGVQGARMPRYKGTVSDEQVWDLVDFLISMRVDSALNYPERRLAVPKAASREESPVPNGYGDFVGVIRWQGEIPKTPVLVEKGGRVKDAEVCAVRDIPDESLLISEKNQGVANVFVYLERSPEHAMNLERLTTPVLHSKNCRLFPHAQILRTDVECELKNDNATIENFHFYPERNDAFNQVLAAGGRAAVKHRRPETKPFPVKSDYHYWVSAWLLPLDHPYAAITDKQGRFFIEGLPAGEHTFVVWHEKANYVHRRLKVVIEEDDVTEVQLKLNASMLK